MLETIKFIEESKENWREILSKEPYCLSINEDDNFAILKYSQLDSDFSYKICKECRGLIIDKNTIEPVALSFIKFFNVQETLADSIDWKSAKVQEKIDGSKMLVWFDKYNQIWRISTSSQLDAYKANVSDYGITFGQLFDKAVINCGFETINDFFNLLDNNFCYTFELVSPESRIVIPYKKTNIYFIGVRNVKTFEEVNPDNFEAICEMIKRPKQYELTSLSSCIDATNKMGYDEEGFVVVDKDWKRVKIKSPAYVQVHYLRGNGINSKGKILSIIEKGEQSEFLGYYPEYKEYFDEVENKYNRYINEVRKQIIDIQEKIEQNESLSDSDKWNKKDFAKYINDNYKDNSGVLFDFLKTDLIDMFIKEKWKQMSKENKMKKLNIEYFSE